MDGNTERTETTRSKVTSDLSVLGGSLSIRSAKLEDSVGGTLGGDVLLAVLLDLGGDTLGDGVEGGELVGDPAGSKLVLSTGVVLEGRDGNLVNGVERLDVVRRSESSDGHHEVDINTLRGERLVNGKLVGSKGTGLVGAENVDTSKRLDGSELLNDSLALGKVSGTDSHGGGGNTGETDGDTNDEEDKGVDEQVVLLGGGDTGVAEEAADPEDEGEDDNEEEKSGTDGAHDLLEVTLSLATKDESGSATDESLLGNVRAENVSLSTLATGSVEDGVTNVLVNGERFTSDGGLITSDDGRSLVDTLVIVLVVTVAGSAGLLEDGVGGGAVLVLVVGKNATITGNSLTILDNDNVTGTRSRASISTSRPSRITVERRAIPALSWATISPACFSWYQPTKAFKHQDSDNDTKVDPVTKTGGEDDGKFHNVKNGTTEETNELEQEVLLGRLELVVTEESATLLDIVLADTLEHVSLEPRGGDLLGDLLDLTVLVDTDLLGLPEGGELTLLDDARLIGLLIVSTRRLLGTDELDKSGVLFRDTLHVLLVATLLVAELSDIVDKKT